MSLELSALESRWEKLSSPIARDLKLNFKKFALDSALSPEEAAMLSLAVGTAVDFPLLEDWARDSLNKLGTEPAKVLEAEESAALMGMLNSYYKFRTFIKDSDADLQEQSYNQAGLRMTALARPAMGKIAFEMLALAVSVVNGCETCVTSHEKVLREGGVTTEKIHDAVRLASVIKALSKLDFEA